MPKLKELSISFLEAVSYGFLGGIFVLCVLFIEDLTRVPPVPGFSLGNGERGIPPGGVLIGGTISVIFWNLLFGRIINSASVRWGLILITSSILALLTQMTFLIYQSETTLDQIIAAYLPENVSELLGIPLMIKLFIILTPFTILFANRHLLIEKIQKRSALK
jgi:uncharacterized membrane protein YhdT